jgi:hypothetical protein
MKSSAHQVAFTVLLMIGAAFGGFRAARIMDSKGLASASPSAGQPHGVGPVADSVGDGSRCIQRTQATKMPCYRAAFVHDIATVGMDSTFAALRYFVKIDPDVKTEVHMYAHGIGIDAFTLHPDVVSTFSHCTVEFSSGCYHGVMQAYFELHGTDNPAVVRSACHPFEGDSKRWLFFQCLHGMGHGLEMTLNHDLPRALKGCDLLDAEWDRQSCYGGVFMENITNATEPMAPATMMANEREGMQMGGSMGSQMGAQPASQRASSSFPPFDRTDPLYPCSAVAAVYGMECYRIQTALILYLNSGNIPAAAKACDGAPTEEFRQACYQSLGRDVTAYANYEPPEAVRLCTVGKASLRGWCYVGVAKTLVDEKATPDPGFSFCRRLNNAEYRSECFEAVGELVISLYGTPAERERVCAPLPEADRRSCRIGAQLEEEPKPSPSATRTASRTASRGT